MLLLCCGVLVIELPEKPATKLVKERVKASFSEALQNCFLHVL